MVFERPLILLLVIPFLLLFFFLGKLERRKALAVSSHEGGRRNLFLWLITRQAPKVLWLAVAVISIFVLAGPAKPISKEGIEVQGRIKCVSLDFSSSMQGTFRSKTGRSSFEVIKDVTIPFIEKRAATDFITVTVYGGRGMGPDNGDATILVRPTQNAEFIKNQIKKAQPDMVGIYTSIGEGIFTCLSSMLDQELEAHQIDRFRLRDSLERESWDYPMLAAKKIGRMKNMIIILFTDGVNNAGIEPLTVIKFVRMLGIKMYFSVLESTGTTGVSMEEEVKRRNALRNAVRATGGFDFETQVAEDVEKHYNEIDKFESAKVRLVFKEQLLLKWRDWLWWAIACLIAFTFVEILFLKLP